MHFTSPWNSSFSGVRSRPITCKQSKKEDEKWENKCRENSKYYTTNKSSQDKPLAHEPHNIQKFPSHNQAVCLLHSALYRERREPKLQSCTTLPTSEYAPTAGFLLSEEEWESQNQLCAHLATAPTLWSIPGVSDQVKQGGKCLSSTFPKPDSLHAAALSWMKAHKTACQPGSSLASTHLKL